MKTVLTIAGSDCSGGAGIQADLKTMTSLGVYGMSVITALTAQNTTGVYGIMDCTPEFVANQLDCIFTDIRPDAVKIGMVSDAALIEVIAEKLDQYQAANIVLDPVMVSTSGSRLLKEDAASVLAEKLIPMADLITPNIPEAEILSGISIGTEEGMVEAAKLIAERNRTVCGSAVSNSSFRRHAAVLVKGGHQLNDANDVLVKEGEPVWFYGKRIENSNTHGTGCTLSSAIACGLACGYDMEESVKRAKAYLSAALSTGLDLGKGSGPLNHCFSICDPL